MAKVGKPFVDIDIEGDVKAEDLGAAVPPEDPRKEAGVKPTQAPVRPAAEETAAAQVAVLAEQEAESVPKVKGKHAALATPAVRHLSKEMKVDIAEINGTGRDGRVLKEDIYKFVEGRNAAPSQTPSTTQPTPTGPATGSFTSPDVSTAGPQQETPVALTRTQEMMFKAMTRSLSIPHFLYADEVDFTSLVELRGRLNKVLAKSGLSDSQVGKLSYLPFIIKAVSMALYKYPTLNARVDIDSTNTNGNNSNNNNSNNNKPTLVLRSQHNIGVAMDTPSGLLVPVVKNVGALNILGIAAELARLQALAVAGRLAPQDMAGGTITVSNIGSIGGTYLSPVVVEREVAILGVGRMRTVPAFSTVPGEEERVVKRQVCNFSWSADHRVVDGATMARAAEVVRAIVEEPDVMVMHLR
jgi:2-oxoisovalerate dehydrogenase E2 component (dihydrolipoyl transacylase)